MPEPSFINSTPLDSYHCPLDGQAMVSAGAGTGKTYNIQILVLRLILSGIPIEKILVVTFTNLATGELQERLRSILLKSLAYCTLILSDLPLTEEDTKTYAQVIPCFDGINCHKASNLLQNSLRDFDFAPISTIHGFCSRALSDNAFESGLRYGLEIRENCRNLTKSLIARFYREFSSAHASDAGKYRHLILHLLGVTPEWLFANLKPALDNPGIPIHWGNSTTDALLSLKALEDSPRWSDFYDRIHLLDIDEAWGSSFSKDVYACFGSYKLMGSKEDPHRLKFAAMLPSAEACMLFFYQDAVSKLVDRKDKIEELLLKGRTFSTPALAALLNFVYPVPLESNGPARPPLQELLQKYRQTLLQMAFEVVNNGIAQAKAQEGFITYDDILLKLRECVDDANNGEKLKNVIKERFRCVIIDEFQDTDANQSAIFKALFTNNSDEDKPTLFFIGDEKQAIYKFRGGDVQTFQNEQQRIAQEGHCYTLTDNFRSSADYIDAMNTFFLPQQVDAGNTDPSLRSLSFFDDPTPTNPSSKIIVEKIGKGINAKERYLLESDNTTHVGGIAEENKDNRLLSCGNAEDVVKDVAREIRALLSSGIQIKTENQPPKRIGPQDIAILLRSTGRIKEYQDALSAQGIPSVFMQTQSVFKSKETQWVMSLMEAVLAPGDTTKALQLLSSPFFGFSLPLQELLKRRCLQEFQQQLKQWNDSWKNKSFFYMFNEFLNQDLGKTMPSLKKIIKEIHRFLSDATSSEERMQMDALHFPIPLWESLSQELERYLSETNANQWSSCPTSQCIVKNSAEGVHSLAVLTQIAERLLEISQKEHLGQGALFALLKAKIQMARKDDMSFGTTKNALLSASDGDEDDDKVYPQHLTTQEDAVQILTIHKSKGLEFPVVFVPSFGHKPKAERIYHDKNVRTVNLCDEDEAATKACLRESVEESRRLMYVAITRAKFLCRFISKLSDDASPVDYPEILLPSIQLTDRFQTSTQPFPTSEVDPLEIPMEPPTTVHASHFGLQNEDLHAGWVTTSFSSIAKGKSKERPLTDEGNNSRMADDEQNENDERSNLPNGDSSDSSLWEITPFAKRTPIFQFPGGTRTGTCWHEIMESLDFTLWGNGAPQDAYEQSWQKVQVQLQNYAQLGGEKTRQERLDAFQTMLHQICNTPLFGGKVTLCQIPMERTLREFSFTYRIRKGMDAEEIRNLLCHDGIAAPTDWSHDIGKDNLTGSIDLLFQNPDDGLFYILDWKTNILEANAESFTKENVRKEINHRFYSFQCVLYALAFVQYIRQLTHGTKFSDAEREIFTKEAYRQFGGCADMLVRGMIEAPENSVHYIRPSEELILALDKRIGVGNECQGE